jgi:nicotinamide-nucleotide amidase
MLLSEIITIGDELLIGQVIDTNSAWIAQRLNEIGIKVKQITSVSDDQAHIIQALDNAKTRAEIILITGGLGPTKDDITKKTLCSYFNTGLKFDEASYEIIESIFRSRGRDVTEINRMQALVPENCSVLLNHNGTAPGMLFESDGKIFVSMPGVPSEMKGLMENKVLPLLKQKFPLVPIVHKTILTQGIGESTLSEKISAWEDNLPENMKLAYLPEAGMVRLRITAFGKNENLLRNEVEEQAAKLDSLIGENIYGYESDKLEALVGKLLREKRKTICTAESCTGGYIAHKITSIPGSSEYYIGSVIAYANEVKVRELNIDMHLLETDGAVSEKVVKLMAENALKKFQTDYSIACSGIAGPGGGTTEKPVGTVWIAISNGNRTFSRKLQLGKSRERVILETAQNALNMLRKMILNESLS